MEEKIEGVVRTRGVVKLNLGSGKFRKIPTVFIADITRPSGFKLGTKYVELTALVRESRV